MKNAPPAAASPLGPLTDAEVERSMKLNVVAGVLGMVWVSVWNGMPLPLLMQAVKASGFQLGLLSGARQFAMLAQLPSALIVERLARRKPFWAVAALVHRAIWIVPALLPVLLPQRREWWPVAIILTLGVSDVLGNASTAPWFSWMADLLPAGRAGRFWGSRHRILSVSIVVSSLAFGIILDAFTGRGFLGFQIVFATAAVFGVADIFVHMGVAEPRAIHGAPSEPAWRRIIAPLHHRDFRRLTLGMGLWTAAVAMPGYAGGLPSFFCVVYLKEYFGASYAQASWVFIASALSAVIWAPRIGHAIDHWGARRMVLLLMQIGPLFSLAWLFVTPGRWHFAWLGSAPVPQPVLLISAASLVVGGVYAGVTLCQFRLTQVLTHHTGRTVAMGVHWSLVGLLGALGPIIAGLIKDHFPRSWNLHLFAGGSPLSYFQVLILLQVAIVWCLARPIVRSISHSALAE